MKSLQYIYAVFIFLSLISISFAQQKLGSFITLNSLHVPRFANIAVTDGKYIFTFGGYPYFSSYSTPYPVEYAKINSDGTLSSWMIESSNVLHSRGYAVGTYSNGYIYEIGGEDYYSIPSTIERVQVNPDGTLGNGQRYLNFQLVLEVCH